MRDRVDGSLGKDLGLTGHYEDTPAFQIINDTHDLFLALTSRLIGLEYGRHGGAVKRQALWLAIDEERSRFAERLSALGGDAVLAANLTNEIRRLDEKVNDLVTTMRSEVTAE